MTNPPRETEAAIVEHEAGCSADIAMNLAKMAEKIRNLREHGLAEGASTRLLIYAGRMIAQGVTPRRACQVSIVWPLTDDREVQRSIEEVVSSIFED